MSETNTQTDSVENLVARYLEAPRPDLKDLIMVECAPMVERLARRFAGLEPQEDLIQVGFIGLLNALSKYDPTTNVKFNTYATHLISGEIKHYLRDRSQTIRQPAWLQELRQRVSKSSCVLQARLGRPPTDDEVAEEIGVSAENVREANQTRDMMRIGSLDSAQSEDDGAEVDQLDSADFCPEQLSVEDRVVLEGAMDQLRDIEKRVLTHFHFDAMNQTEIAHALGISCNYVSHILRQSLAKLRRILTAEEEQDRILRRQASVLDDDVLDPATGLYNEDYFRNRVAEELHRAASGSGVMGLLLVDFTGLKSLSGFYGENSVRDFLNETGAMLKDSVRRLDIVCRYGECGFAVILPSTGPSAAIVRQRLQARFDAWLNVRRSPAGEVRAQIGHAAFPDDATSIDTLLEAAAPRPAEATIDEAAFRAA